MASRWPIGLPPTRLRASCLRHERPLPPREEWDKWLAEHGSDDQTATIIRSIREIEESGGEVLTAAADAADLNQMKRVIDLARERLGGIDGVVHAAGVPGSGRIAFLKQPDDIQSVFSPKVGGLDVLVRLLGETPLDFVALISSINSVLGAPGLSDYAGANAVLDAFPDSKLRPTSWKHVVSIDWGPWRDLGMAAKLFESNPKTDSAALPADDHISKSRSRCFCAGAQLAEQTGHRGSFQPDPARGIAAEGTERARCRSGSADFVRERYASTGRAGASGDHNCV